MNSDVADCTTACARFQPQQHGYKYPPTKSFKHLLKNNYGSSSAAAASKVEAYVRVDADRVQHSGGRGKAELGRDVFVVKGDVKLGKSGGRVGKR